MCGLSPSAMATQPLTKIYAIGRVGPFKEEKPKTFGSLERQNKQKNSIRFNQT